MEEKDILQSIIKTTQLGLEVLNQEDPDDSKVLLDLLDCVDIALTFPRRKKKRIWIKPWDDASGEGGITSMDNAERQAEAFSVCCNLLALNKEAFEELFNLFSEDLQRQNTLMRDAVSPIEKFSAILRIMATGCSYKITCLQTRLSQSFICCATPYVCRTIWNNLEEKYMKLPSSPGEWENIATEFALKYQFPNCLGVLFTKHIKFRCLKKEKETFLNSKGFTSMVLLAAVDANCRFIYIDMSSTGSVDDTTALAQSTLGKMIENGELNLPNDRNVGRKRKLPYVFLGNKGLPLHRNIMVPFTFNELNQANGIYNNRLYCAREVAELAFGIMSQRFKIFQNIISFRSDNVINITKACCMLHNYLLEHDEEYINIFQGQGLMTEQDDDYDEEIYVDEEFEKIRQGFVSYFNNQGRVSWHNPVN